MKHDTPARQRGESGHCLVCFPYAGAGASLFRSWVEPLSPLYEVMPVQLPGREERFADPLCASVHELIDSTLPRMLPQWRGKKDLVVFGHSVGAFLAFELTVRLTRECGVPVRRLVVSGSHAPTRPRSRRATGLSSEQFLARVREFAAYAHPSLENDEVRDLLLPVLRADVEMHESYAWRSVRPLRVPITCIRGQSDDLVAAADLAHWQEVTSHELQLVEVGGGHMYWLDSPASLFNVLLDVVRSPE